MNIKKVNTKIVIEELHRAFKLFNKELFNNELPEPAILIQSRGNKKLTLGWCTVAKVWKNDVTQEEKYEINLVAEALNRGVYPVMSTLLHEMVHLHNLVKGIKDVSRGNTYHNMKFKNMAEAHGLVVEHADKIGWSVTKLSGLVMDMLDENHFDNAIFSFGRRDFDFEGAGKPRKKAKTSSRKYICPCCGTSIRASKDVNILCADCTDFSKGKIVAFYKEVPEEEAPAPTDEPMPVDEPIKIEKACKTCGCISEVPEDEEICPECGEAFESEPEEVNDPVEPKGIEEPETSIEIIEIDTEFTDEEATEIKQGMINTPVNSGWTVEKIVDVLLRTGKEAESFGLKNVFPEADTLPVEISEKLKAQWGNYKEGKKFTLSESYLKEAHDLDIIDTIKHLYLHHHEYICDGLKVNHKKPFKHLCVQFGVSEEVPTKNHRAMK